jgi:aminopeptidase N
MPRIFAYALPMPYDVHSFARPDEARVKHLILDLDVDFDKQRLSGSATLEIDGSKQLILDTNGLSIDRVTSDGNELKFSLGESVKHLGRSLTIPLPQGAKNIRIDYTSAPDAAAVQWLTPKQTAGGEHPFLFTQSQAILARTWVPCQDTPGVRMTYEATIRVPKGLLAVMSAENPTTVSADGVYHFRMPQAIPSYLLALAAGDLAFRSLGRNCGVYAEKPIIDSAAWELADTQKMIDAAEKIYGPYRWGQYDILVLPPSFPFGGMENPRLTFATPTILAGDRSLVNLVAHELAHSWSGNLVTNATWNDFWLNEGFTTYVERRLMEKLRGKDTADVQWALGMADLTKTLADYKVTDPKTFLARSAGPDEDPDDALTDVAYEKGALLLRALELAFGREKFDAFLRQRFDRRAFQSTDTETFEAEANAELFAAHPVPWKLATWIHAGGIPTTTPPPTSATVTKIQQLGATIAMPPAGWNTVDWVVYLRAVPKTVTATQLEALDAAYHLSDGNDEILMHWLPLLITADVARAAPLVESYLARIGRRRMVRPVVVALMAKSDTWRALARASFAKAKAGYHPLTREMVEELVR